MKTNPLDKHLQPLTAHDYIGAGSWIALAIFIVLITIGKI